ncbi:iron-containing redox enzyme family protein [Pseudomonas sp. RIT-PI-AD]|uniref:iron-containing redox enzyme family protein n=1 Tax=Pseudomonas sp. RIT-PI-AD TaxID=3035294 RepID=UPI0021D9969B|nr:iron-containing redox enzyme family protein [Pseudomonas sp. RIT-PI-AD]
MTTLTPISTQPRAMSLPHPSPVQDRDVYQALLEQPLANRELGRDYLERQLARAQDLPCDLPKDARELSAWVIAGAKRTTAAYNQYLTRRKQGQPRRYFANRSHALYFIHAVAPTKLVDGAWLHGVLPRWYDARFQGLARTYLEELGDGNPAQNHVVLYKKLLASHGCEDTSMLSDAHFTQGALQLVLGTLAEDYLPEVIGYNLGYEQLPLHLLITAFELSELDIDPYYFQLHVTIDNASTGHAHKAAQAVLDNLPVIGDAEAFYRRVALGYRLNDLGLGTTAVIEAFDLERELLAMFERKRETAGMVHSDFCRIEGRTVNEWLSRPGQIGEFLGALETRGWIRRHQDPAESRFWQLVQGDRAVMFGVFSPYEQQLLHDWIAGDWLAAQVRPKGPQGRTNFRQWRRPGLALGNAAPGEAVAGSEFDRELTALKAELQGCSDPERLARLIELMAPALHSTPPGLLATRLFRELTQ